MDESYTKVSIAMATYNGGKYLKEQLESFAKQTRQPDELIITDDCSTDDTEEIVNQFSKEVDFVVKFYRNEKNLGYCGNFNKALLRTSGDIVFLSDQDDVWFSRKIESKLNVFKDHPNVLLAMNDAELTDGELKPLGLTKIGQIKSARMNLNSFVMGCCAGVRGELLKLCLPIPEKFKAHDTWIVWFSEALESKVVDTEVLQFYRRHESNESKFLANATKKIGLLSTLRWIFNYSKDNSFENLNKVEQLDIFINGIDRILNLKDEKLVSMHYRRLLEEYKLEKVFLRDRILARNKPFFSRTTSILRFSVRGRYKKLGLRHILRDFLG